MSHSTKAKSIERDFPHIVETTVPEGGLSKTLDGMYDFHRRHGIEPRIGQEWVDEHGRDHIRWCFAVPTIATLFRNEFGVR
jgi:hypothetical protein